MIRAICFVLALSIAGAFAQRPWGAPAQRSRFDPPAFTPPSGPLPGIEERHPQSDVYFAVQYGAKPTDVVYLHLNAPRAETVRDVLNVFGPSDGGVRLIESPRGSPITSPLRDGAGTIRGREFRVRGLESQVDDVKFRTELIITSGHRQWDVIHLSANVQMESPAGRAAYRIGGRVHSFVGLTPGDMKAIPVVGQPRFRVGPGKFDPSRISASLTLGEFPVMPGAGMGRDVRAVLTEKESGRRQQIRARWEDRPYLGLRPFEILAQLDANVKRGATYTLTGELDLGPVFGLATAETTFTAPTREAVEAARQKAEEGK